GQEQHMVAQLFPDVAEEMMERRRALAVATGLLALDDQPVEAEVEGGSRVLDRRDLRPDAGAGTLEDRDPGGGGQAEMEDGEADFRRGRDVDVAVDRGRAERRRRRQEEVHTERPVGERA